MKKVSLMIAAFALVLGLSQCNKEKTPAMNGETQHIVLTANNGNDGSKVSGSFASAALNLTWDGDESIIVSGGATGTLRFVSGAGDTSAKFEGEITKVKDEDIKFTLGSAPSSYLGQLGTKGDCETWIKGHNHFVGTSPWQDDGNYSVNMELKYAVLKLDLSALGTETGNIVTIFAGDAEVASVAGVKTTSKEVYVAVPADGTPKTYSIEGNSYGALKTWTLVPNTFYTKQGGKSDPTGEAFVIEPTYINFNDDAMSVSDLPKWALKNIGATNGSTAQSWYGDYYAWGETEPYYTSINWTSATSCTVGGWNTGSTLGGGGNVNSSKGYAWESYCNGSSNFVEWNALPCTGAVPYNATSNVLKEDYDVARKALGGTWRMPTGGTSGEWKDMKDNTFWVWTDSYKNISGLKGYIVYKVKDVADKGERDNPRSSEIYTMSDPHMFLPTAGGWDGTLFDFGGDIGFYWTSSLYSGKNARHMELSEESIPMKKYGSRYCGRTVRPVW